MGNGVMRRELPLPQELWDQIPAHIQAALWVVVDGYEQRLATLEAQVAGLQGEVRELKEQLNQTSQNSSRPPSSDGPRVQRQPPRQPSGRKRGRSPGTRRTPAPCCRWSKWLRWLLANPTRADGVASPCTGGIRSRGGTKCWRSRPPRRRSPNISCIAWSVPAVGSRPVGRCPPGCRPAATGPAWQA